MRCEIPGKVECDLFSLPVRLGGLGLFNPTVTAIRQHACSLHTSSPLVDLIVSQIHDASSCFAIQIQLRSEVLATHRKELQEFTNNIYDQLPSELQSSVELACKRGASNWLSCLPFRSHGFALHKSAFRDGLLLRYHWTPLACPTSCACGYDFTIDHCISCPKGGFLSLRHNEFHDLTAKMMSEVCNNVSIEPRLQPLSGEALCFKTANSDSNARLDIAANGFWGGRFEGSFFMSEFSTLVHHLIILLSLLIVAMRGRRDVSISSMFVRLSMAILNCLFLPPQGKWVMLLAKYTRDWQIY